MLNFDKYFKLLNEMYSDDSYLSKYSTDKSKVNTHDAQNSVSSIVYKNEGSAMGGSGIAYLERMIQQSKGKFYKGKIPKGVGTTEVFFYGSSEEAQDFIDTFKKQHPQTDKFKYSISLGLQNSQSNYTGQFKDEQGTNGTLWR